MTAVQQFQATCTRCGQGINNICRFEGKAYGTECILHVTGNQDLLNHIRSLRRNRKWSLDADTWLKEQADRVKAEEARLVEWEQTKQQNAESNAWLIEVLQAELNCYFIKTVKGVNIYSRNMDFIESLVSDLHARLLVELSDRRKDILIDIYAKSFGRRNSKAYSKAYDEAYNKAYPVLEMGEEVYLLRDDRGYNVEVGRS